MDSSIIPVTLDFFKKYTYHEEWIDILFKAKAKGNQQIYEALCENNESKERAFKLYYEAFYLKPQIREKYHIRIKPVPKKIKDKLLQIPPQGITVGTKEHIGNNKMECPMQQLMDNDLVNVCKSNSSEIMNAEIVENRKELQRKHLNVHDEDDKDLNIEDDNEPLNSPEKSVTSEENNKLNKERSITLSKAANDKSKEVTAMENGNRLKHNLINSEVQKLNENAKTQTQSDNHKKSPVNYKNLIPYIHCCPVTYKEFCKYSNIKQLVKGFCEKKHVDISEERLILNRSYILFYLASEHRTKTPINKIQLTENCPVHIRNKFFDVPTNLYLKEQVNMENAKITTSPKEQCIHAASNGTEKNSKLQKTNISYNDNNSYANEKLPVSLEEFKKYTHYEAIIDNLFKDVAHDNEVIYWKYKNSKEAFDSTLMNYYRAFYLIPIVREKFPIHFKPTPKSLKCRLLQIPEGVDTSFINIRAEQLVFPELHNFVEVKKENMDTGDKVMEENQLLSLEATNNLNTSITKKKSSPTFFEKENEIEFTNCGKKLVESSEHTNSNTNSHSNGAKRAIYNGNNNEQPSPKRLKVEQQTEDYTNDTEKTNKNVYKNLLPYAHCCPVTFSEFKKYTNISELFTGYCQTRYKDLRKLPYIIRRAYVLYYLAPENRKFKPFTKLKITDDCPERLKKKMFKIPTNLYLLEGKQKRKTKYPDLQLKLKEEKSSETQKQNENNLFAFEQQQEPTILDPVTNNPKVTIEILENRLLPPTIINLQSQVDNAECTTALHCSDSVCVFYYISHHDFMLQTNILQILPQPHDIITIRNIFKKFIHKIIKESNCDDLYVHGALLSKILKHQHLCKKCEGDIVNLINMDTVNACNETEQERRTQSTPSETIVEKCGENTESTNTNKKENLTTNIQVEVDGTETRYKKQPQDLIKYLKNYEIFEMFRQKLLAKLSESYDTVDFCSDTYSTFLQCNEIPLIQILNDFCVQHKDIVERILTDVELYNALQRYYYFKYLTNRNFAIKYPIQIKNPVQSTEMANENILNIKETEKNETVVAKPQNRNINSTGETIASLYDMESGQQDNTLSKPQGNSQNSKENTAKDAKTLEKAKRVFFRTVEKTNTLSYVVRTSFGLKQAILRCILTLSYDEFVKFTHIYEGESMYADSHITECMYRFVFRSPVVWPTNLYIKLQNLYDLLHEKNIRFNDFSTMLKYISPKLLHWSDLISCTNIVNCVKIDYERRTGKSLNEKNETIVAHECNEYYNRCWKYEKWLGEIPLVYFEFYANSTNYANNCNKANVPMLDKFALQEISETVEATANVDLNKNMGNAPTPQEDISEQNEMFIQNLYCNEKMAPEYISEINIESAEELNTTSNANQSVKEFNCILLPNTQQQIDMLPAEARVANDPLNHSMSDINLNSLSSTNEKHSLGELNSSIKNEPINTKLLNNLLFYEDDNGNIQCTPYKEEIINLDESLSQISGSLPASQLHFDEAIPKLIPSGDLVASDNSNSTLNLAQHLPSTDESYGTPCNQQVVHLQNTLITSTQLIQLPDVSLGSNGESDITSQNIKQDQNQNTNQLSDEVEKELKVITGEKEVNSEDFPQSIEKLTNILQKLPNSDKLFSAIQENVVADAQNFSNTLKDMRSESAENSLNVKESTSEIEQQKQVHNQANSGNSMRVQVDENLTGDISSALPVGKRIPQTVKIKKNVAKVRPLKNSDLVPQIRHITRPLETKPIHPPGGGSINDEDLKQEKQISNFSDKLLQNFNLNVPSTQNSSFQLQLMPAATHIHVSQELNTNCSVFNNSSLLRIADHNYQLISTDSPSTSIQAKSQSPQKESATNKTSSEESQQQSSQIVARKCYISSENDNQRSNTKSSPKMVSIPGINTQTPLRKIIRKTDICIQTSSARIIRRASMCKDNNDKVNNDVLTRTNNLIVTVSPIIRHHLKIVRKQCLYRKLLKFHYFKELTPHHISHYLLPSIEFGKSYSEVTLICDNFKTRISNKSIASIFPFWSQTLQRDFLLVLNDLKEYHYVAFQRNTMKKHDDLRARILFWLLNTAPSFALCQFIFEANNTEFAHCERIHNGNNPSYRRKPFTNLTKAIDLRILEKLKDLKRKHS